MTGSDEVSLAMVWLRRDVSESTLRVMIDISGWGSDYKVVHRYLKSRMKILYPDWCFVGFELPEGESEVE